MVIQKTPLETKKQLKKKTQSNNSLLRAFLHRRHKPGIVTFVLSKITVFVEQNGKMYRMIATQNVSKRFDVANALFVCIFYPWRNLIQVI